MHLLTLLIEIAAIVTPIIGIAIELRRDVSDDEDGGRRQPARLTVRPLGANA